MGACPWSAVMMTFSFPLSFLLSTSDSRCLTTLSCSTMTSSTSWESGDNGDMLCTVPVLKVLGYKQTEDLDPTPGAHVGRTDIALFRPLVISCLLFALKLFRTRMKRYLFPLTGCCDDDHWILWEMSVYKGNFWHKGKHVLGQRIWGQ